MDDELDEQKEAALDGHTRTIIWDVRKLDMPTIVGNFYSSEQSIGKFIFIICLFVYFEFL